MAKEAAAGWIEAAADYGQEIPKPSALDEIKNNPDYKGWMFGEIDIDLAY